MGHGGCNLISFAGRRRDRQIRMWRRSASFVVDNRIDPLSPSDSTTFDQEQNPITHEGIGIGIPPVISAYYQTRTEHHAVVTSDWLAQSQKAAVDGTGMETPPAERAVAAGTGRKGFRVTDEFNYWRKKPDLAEAVAAIMALSSVIKCSEATTMMELEGELKEASNSLKVIIFLFL